MERAPDPPCSCGHELEAHCWDDGVLKPWCHECVCKAYDGYLAIDLTPPSPPPIEDK